MTERFIERELAPNLVRRQYAFMLIASWQRDVETGAETVQPRFRTAEATLQTDADTETGEAEIAPRAELPDLHVSPGNLDDVLDVGIDPVTGEQITISTAGILKSMKRLYESTVEANA